MTAADARTVVLTSGHMIDAPDRSSPRFPATLEPVVANRIERMLDKWEIGPGDLILNGGARGADILCAESAHRRGSDVELILALPPDEFEEQSVVLPDSIWLPAIPVPAGRLSLHRQPGGPARSVTQRVRPSQRRPDQAGPGAGPPERLKVLLVWDEEPAGGPGGTGDFAVAARELGAELEIINPTSL